MLQHAAIFIVWWSCHRRHTRCLSTHWCKEVTKMWCTHWQHSSGVLVYMWSRGKKIHSARALSTLQVSVSVSLYHTYIWIRKSVCATPIESNPSVCISDFFLILFPSCSSSVSSLTCSGAAGFLQTFRFSSLAFWWGDTRHIVESSRPGGILIEAKQERATWRRQRQCRGRQGRGATLGSENLRLSSKDIKWKGVWARQAEQSMMEI